MEKKRWCDKCPKCGLNFWLGLAYHSGPPLSTIRKCRRCGKLFICDNSKLFYPVIGIVVGVGFVGAIIGWTNPPLLIKVIFLACAFLCTVYAVWKAWYTPCITSDKFDTDTSPHPPQSKGDV